MNLDHPTLQQVPLLRELWKEAFGDSDDFLDLFFESGFAPGRCLCAMDGDALAAAAYWFPCGECAYIYAVATAKSHRGRGICHGLMSAIHALLTQQGYAGAIVVPGEESLRGFYGGMGYENFGGIRQWRCGAADRPEPLRQLSADEFAALRRGSLPEGGVVQEGVNLAYLSRLVNFYAGNGFLLAAVMEGTTLYAPELLGNTAAAEGITAAFGAKEGRFRSPGEIPFAMYKVLAGEKIPTYFGFAFD